MSTIHSIKAVPAGGQLARSEQLAWKIAEVAAGAKDVPLDADVKDMVINRIIDNAAIALAGLFFKIFPLWFPPVLMLTTIGMFFVFSKKVKD